MTPNASGDEGAGPAEPPSRPRPRGPRPGGSDTRAAILAAARAEFATRGYDGARIRSIADSAGVDPALVHHYFGAKAKLFAAALELPFNPGDIFAKVLVGGIDGAGERLLRAAFTAWENAAARAPMLAVIRTATSSDAGAAMLREFLDRNVLQRVATDLTPDRPRLRAALVASQMAGLLMARYVICLPAVAEAPIEDLITAVSPNLQHYLTGDLTG
ncbi:MAG: TetR/AcrR family transcriptional regulator [Geodermatophilaceae bacterium]|nr:TetR/AcrR family transcriptional regulator [Geodermatophilaceae bacterium]